MGESRQHLGPLRIEIKEASQYRPRVWTEPAGNRPDQSFCTLRVEYLPPYAPDLNPLEGLWANLKGVELANRACRSLEELAAAAEQGIGRVRGESELLFSFLHQAGLSL